MLELCSNMRWSTCWEDIPRILAEAAKLYYVKDLEIIDKPDPSSDKTYEATYPAYISDFKTSDDADGIGRWFFSKIY